MPARRSLLLVLLAGAVVHAQTCGDCAPVTPDGATTILDALAAAQHSAAVMTLAPALTIACDVHPETTGGSCDGDVDILDALTIAQGAAGLLASLDCCLGPIPGTPGGWIRAPNHGTCRGDVPVRFDALDGDFDPLDILVEYTTDGGVTYAPATMSDFVLHYLAYGTSYAGETDEASYRTISYGSGTGTFTRGEVITGGISGATGVIYDGVTPGPAGTLDVFMTGGQLLDCEGISGGTSGASGLINGPACGSVSSGRMVTPRNLVLGSGLFAPPASAGTANPVLGVAPGRAFVFVWDSETDLPAAVSPVTVMLQVTLDDGGGAVSFAGGSLTVDNRPVTTDHLLITEIAVTGGEFVEIHNPTALAVDLTDYYLTDATHAPGSEYYWHITGGGSPGGGSYSDWFVQFPPGTSIGPGEYIVVAGSNIQFFARYGVDADYEMCLPCAGTIPCMLPAGGGIDSSATCGGASGTSALTDSGEMVVLFHWDGVSATVEDADYIVWGDQAEAVDKTGEPGYQPETPIASQSVLPPGFPDGDLHNVNWTASRTDLEEGGETLSGGNGITGHDETSETFESTWTFVGIATPGRRNLRRPPMDDAIGVGDIVVNEVLYDVPAGDDVNGDGTYDQYQDAFIEVVNVTAAPVDLGLWRVYNVRTVHGLSHEIPPGTVLAPGQALVVWGGGEPVAGGCGRLNQIASADSLWFNVGSSCDAADGIVLVNGSWFIDGHYDCDNAIGAAFVRDPDLTGPFVFHPSTPGGLLHSPGCRQDGVTGF